MNAWVERLNGRLVALRTYDSPRFAEIVVTRYPDEPPGFAWIGGTHLPVRITREMLRTLTLPWPLGEVRYDIFMNTIVFARKDGWRWFTFAAYWTAARSVELWWRGARKVIRALARSGWWRHEPGTLITRRSFWTDFVREKR